MVRIVLLLRHGETALNRRGAFRGLADVPLSERGVSEAERLAARVVGAYRLSAVYASPLERARATALPIATAYGVTVQTDERFIDLDYGPWTGKARGDLAPDERRVLNEWHRQPDVPLPGAESPERVQARALAGLEACAARAGECVAIVSHEVVIQVILCDVLGLAIRNYRALAQHMATLNELGRVGPRWRVLLLDSAWHLDEEEC